MGTVRIRDVITNRHYDLAASASMLRVPYDLWRARGPAVLQDGMVEIDVPNGHETARTKAGQLSECHPGERVLVQHPDTDPDPRLWWLCEIETVDGNDAT